MINDLDDQYRDNDRYDAEDAIIEYRDKFVVKKKVWYWLHDGFIVASGCGIIALILLVIAAVLIEAGKIVASVVVGLVLVIAMLVAIGYAWNEIVPNIPEWVE